jgi:hypothetical protein
MLYLCFNPHFFLFRYNPETKNHQKNDLKRYFLLFYKVAIFENTVTVDTSNFLRHRINRKNLY